MNNNRCLIIFYRHPIIDYNFSYYDKEVIFEVLTTVDNARKKSIIIDYIQARLTLKHLGFHISRCWALGTPHFRNIDNEIRSAKANITKIKNSISTYEQEQSNKLIPDFENSKYLRTKEKLLEYQIKLQELILEKEQKNTN